MRVSTNIASLNAQREVVGTQRTIEKGMNELASGSRINKAADDAAGLALSKDFEMNIRSAGQATRNANDAISVIQIAEGSFNEMNNVVVRLRELAMQSASDTIADPERHVIASEAKQLSAEMERISQATRWGSKHLLTGEGGSYEFQIGYQADADANRIKVDFKDIDTRVQTLGLDGTDLSTKEGARQSLEKLDRAQASLSARRTTLGALQNRMNSTMDNLLTASQNMSASKSALSDADLAEASSDVAKGQITIQAGVSVIAQANQSPNAALKLLS